MLMSWFVYILEAHCLTKRKSLESHAIRIVFSLHTILYMTALMVFTLFGW